MAAVAWTCPHCQRPQMLTDDNFQMDDNIIEFVDLPEGRIGTRSVAMACVNEACKKLTLSFQIHHTKIIGGNRRIDDHNQIQSWQLLPESGAKSQPEYIPLALRQDYYEACRIRELSPKASATLARRCLQGMIRDFCNIAKGTLSAEIDALEEAVAADKAPRGVTPESVEAIDHARKIGNIGAHMEKDINLVVDIDSEEAQILLDLVETLFEEWYVARENRAARFAGIAALRAAKDAAKKGGKP